MNGPSPIFKPVPFTVLFLLIRWFILLATFRSVAAASQGEILGKEGSVDFAEGKASWSPATVGQPLNVADRLRTLGKSRAMVQLAELGSLEGE